MGHPVKRLSCGLMVALALTIAGPVIDHPLRVFAATSSAKPSQPTSAATAATPLRRQATATTVVTPPPAYSAAILGDRPVVYYRLGQTGCCLAVDSSGHNFNGTYGSGITYAQPGLLVGDSDTAIITSGAGTAVTAGDSVLPSSTARTVELWAKSSSTLWQTFVSYGVGIGGQLFMVSTRGPSFLDLIGYSGDDAQFATPYPINDGRAHHLAITYDGGVTVTAYVDGQQIGQQRLPSPLTTALGSGLQIGGGLDGPFSGTLDEVAIYPVALSPAQLNAHWSAGVGAGCAAAPTVGYAGGVAADIPSHYWRLGETGGAAALDVSGNCHNAAYAKDVTHGIGLILGDSDGSVGNPTPAGTILSASPDALPGGSSPRTFEFWERTTATYQTFLSYGLASDGGFYFMLSMRSPSTLVFFGANDNFVFSTPYPINDGRPHHIAFAYDGGQGITAFLDGQRLGQGLIQRLNTIVGAKALEIGNGVDGPFVGTLDEVAVYPRALDSMELNKHWQAGVLAAACQYVPTSGYGKAVVGDGAIRYWRLGDSSAQAAQEYAGHCAAAAAYVPTVYHVPGLLPNDADGATYSAPAGGIASASADGLPSGASPRTVEFWEQSTNPYQTFLSYGRAADGGFYFMVSARGPNTLAFIGGNDNFGFVTPYPLNDGTPHHVAVSYDGGQLVTAFLDGQQIGLGGIQSPLNTDPNAQALQIGNGIDGPFVGTMDEVAIYPTALSAGQIATHEAATGPSISGTVLNGTYPMAGAVVQLCPVADTATCFSQTVTTSSAGRYFFRAPAGTYVATAYPSPDSLFPAPVTIGPITLPPSVTDADISFTSGTAGGTFTTAGGSETGGTPQVNTGEPSTYTVASCKGGYGFLVILATNSSTGQLDSFAVPLVETPPDSGTYVAQIPALAPMHGSATATQVISCPGRSPVFPGGGPPAGGTKVILTVGSAADQVTAVSFGTQPAQSFKVLANGFMEAVSPPGTDRVTVSVSTPGNSSLAIGPFTYSEVTGLSSTSGPQDGGGTVTITGSGFDDAQAVMFGYFQSPSFTVDSPTQITARVPAGTPGPVPVRVVGNHHVTDIGQIYNFIKTFIKDNGPILKLLTGQAISAYLKAAGASATSQWGTGVLFKYLTGSRHDIQGIYNAVVDKTALSLIGTAFVTETAGIILVAAAPWILLAGVIGLGVIVGAFIYWRFFIDPSGTIEDTAGNPVSSATATLLRRAGPTQPFVPVGASSATLTPAINPETTGPTGAFHWDAIAGSYQVQASASGCTAPGDPSQSTVSTPGFVIPPPAVGLILTLACPNPTPAVPAVTAVTPNQGLAVGGTQVSISGTGFGAATSVHFGSAAATGVTILSPSALVATVPAGATGTAVDVTVTAPGGTSAIGTADVYGYYTPAVGAGSPTINSVSPANGAVVGGTLVTINGTNLGSTTDVLFGNRSSTSVTIVSPTQVTAIAPASLLLGRVDITLYNAIGPSAPSAGDAYYYGTAIPSTTTVAASANPSVFGQPITFQATVTAGATGAVQFAVDGANLGGPVALSGGQATSPAVANLSVGTHAIATTYAGDAGFLGSSANLTQTVNQAATSTTLASSQNPSIVNNAVTFTATVAPTAPGAGSPTGTVQFTANGANLGASMALAGGQASLTSSALAPGHFAVTAIYSGDGNFTTSTSAAITQAVRNNLIVFSSTRDGNLELYSMRPDGTAQTRLTNNPAQDSEPILSPDGTQIAFTSTRSGNLDIYVMKTAPESTTNVPRNLTNNAAGNADATWSKDGTKIVFASGRTGRSQLWITNADGTGTATRLTNDTANDINPALSPDGTRLAYASDATGRLQLYVATLTASLTIASTTRLTTDQAYDATPAWSPDSRLIAFTGTATWNPEIWVIPAAGGTAVRETSNPSSADFGPSWSPDGSTIAFTKGMGSGLAVYVITFNATGFGTGQTALTPAKNELPNWCCTGAP